jgi:putative PIG3 family NAD(P)H quinone oxidoreductase
MRAVLQRGFGGPDVLYVGETDAPTAAPGRVLIRVAAASVNRPDVVQREGHYPPPPGESPILGLDAAGTVEAVGAGVTGFAPGDRVIALLPGGGYAELAAAPAGQVLKLPDRLSFAAGACVPETYITAYMNLFTYARLAGGETVLLHGGGGGVTTAAIQLCQALVPRARVLVTASPDKIERVAALGGVERVIDYKSEDFAAVALEHTAKRGVDVILDHVGGPYLERNIKTLAVGGRLALIGIMGGRQGELDLARVLTRRLSILGSVLRPRPLEEKADIVRAFARDVMPHFASGRIAPLVDRVYALDDVAAAHRDMEAGRRFGKLVLALTAEGWA